MVDPSDESECVQEEASVQSAAPCAQEGGDMSGTNRETGDTEESFESLFAEGMAQVAESVADAGADDALPADADSAAHLPVQLESCEDAPVEGPSEEDEDSPVEAGQPESMDTAQGTPASPMQEEPDCPAAPGDDPVEAADGRAEQILSWITQDLDALLKKAQKACQSGDTDPEKMSQVWGGLIQIQGLVTGMNGKYIASQKAMMKAQDELISLRDTVENLNSTYIKMKDQLEALLLS